MRFSYLLIFLCTVATLGAAADLQPSEAPVVEGLPSKSDAILFMAGFIERLTGKNDLVAINDCFKNGTDITRQIFTIIDDLAKRDKFDIEAAMSSLIDMLKQVDERLSNCSTTMKPEI